MLRGASAALRMKPDRHARNKAHPFWLLEAWLREHILKNVRRQNIDRRPNRGCFPKLGRRTV